jgi:hypothetical protein
MGQNSRPKAKTQRQKASAAPKSRRELIRDLLSKIEDNFKVEETKVTLADFIRLTQLERELETEEEPREIIITWSEPREQPNVER